MTAEEREQLLAEIQAIPDGTVVAVYANAALVETTTTHAFTVTGEIYTIQARSGLQRYVGDTLISYQDDVSSKVEFVKPVVREVAA